jgi:hypothetical protein
MIHYLDALALGLNDRQSMSGSNVQYWKVPIEKVKRGSEMYEILNAAKIFGEVK